MTDFDFDEEPEPDLGLIKDLHTRRGSPTTSPSRIFDPSAVQKQQDDVINEVHMILDMRKEEVAILLAALPLE